MLRGYRVVLVIETRLFAWGMLYYFCVLESETFKKASSLLINLAVADFLVGARELIDTLVNYNDRMMFAQGDKPLIISAILFSSASVFSLSLLFLWSALVR